MPSCIQSAWVGGSYGSSFWYRIVVPSWPFQIVLYCWKCSTNRPVAVTPSPLTTTPFRPVLVFQRSVSPEKPSTPWSARHTQVWSIRTSSLLTSSATSDLPTWGPPTRKYTSESVVGLDGSLFELCLGFLPTCRRNGDSTVPASIVRPATITPGTSATVSGTAPPTAVRVACPMPRTTVLARFTEMLLPTS